MPRLDRAQSPQQPAPARLIALAAGVAVSGLLVLGGCMQSASTRWAQTAPLIEPLARHDAEAVVRLGARSDLPLVSSRLDDTEVD